MKTSDDIKQFLHTTHEIFTSEQTYIYQLDFFCRYYAPDCLAGENIAYSKIGHYETFVMPIIDKFRKIIADHKDFFDSEAAQAFFFKVKELKDKSVLEEQEITELTEQANNFFSKFPEFLRDGTHSDCSATVSLNNLQSELQLKRQSRDFNTLITNLEAKADIARKASNSTMQVQFAALIALPFQRFLKYHLLLASLKKINVLAEGIIEPCLAQANLLPQKTNQAVETVVSLKDMDKEIKETVSVKFGDDEKKIIEQRLQDLQISTYAVVSKSSGFFSSVKSATLKPKGDELKGKIIISLTSNSLMLEVFADSGFKEKQIVNHAWHLFSCLVIDTSAQFIDVKPNWLEEQEKIYKLNIYEPIVNAFLQYLRARNPQNLGIFYEKKKILDVHALMFPNGQASIDARFFSELSKALLVDGDGIINLENLIELSGYQVDSIEYLRPYIFNSEQNFLLKQLSKKEVEQERRATTPVTPYTIDDSDEQKYFITNYEVTPTPEKDIKRYDLSNNSPLVLKFDEEDSDLESTVQEPVNYLQDLSNIMQKAEFANNIDELKEAIVNIVKGEIDINKKLKILDEHFIAMKPESCGCFCSYWSQMQKNQIKSLKMAYVHLLNDKNITSEIIDTAKQSKLVNAHRNKGLRAIGKTTTRGSIEKIKIK